MDPESVDVTAGAGGFLAFFLLAVALYFLMRNMNARMRRMAYRQEQEDKAAERAQGVSDGDDHHGGDGDDDGDSGSGPSDSSDSSGPQDGPDIR